MDIDGWQLWILAAIIGGALEMALPGFVVLWFAVGALVAALAAAIGLGINVQLTIFMLVSVALFAGSRTIFKKAFMRNASNMKTGVEAMVGQEAVVTEASHLALRGGGGAELPLEFLLTAGIPILGLEAGGQRRAAVLMKRYADVPMDYADATLVALAEALHISQVFTTDRRGFAAYRRQRQGTFTLLP